MKYSINTEIKRVLNKKGFLFVYIIFLFFSIFALLQYENSFKISYTCELAIINLDKSEKSLDFIEKLEKNPAVKITSIENYDAEGKYDEKVKNNIEKMIQDAKINACVIIPKDFFLDLPNSKLKLIYAEGDVLSPALIDIISQGFIEDVTEKIMYNKVKSQYGEKEANNSLPEYHGLKDKDFFDLEVIIESYNSLKGIKNKISIDDINGLKAIFMYLMTFNFLFVGLSLQIFKTQGDRIIKRMRVANNANRDYYIASTLISNIIIILIPIIISLVSAILLGIKTLNTIYLIFAVSVISIFILELLKLFTSLLGNGNGSFLLSIISIILLSLTGGAFFSINILSPAFVKIASYSPFYVMSSSFYNAIEGSFNASNSLICYILLSILLYTFNYKLNKNTLK